jgi:alpha-terpineol hydroxylase
MATTVPDLTVPHDIAHAIIHPTSYGRPLEEEVIPAGQWLRDNMPIGRAKIDGYDEVWLLSKHADIQAVAKDNVTFHNGDANPLFNSQADDAFARELTGGTIRTLESFSYMDPPEHTGYREVVGDHFQPRVVREKYEETFKALAKQLVDELMDFDGECDFVQDFAAHYPTRVTMAVLGVPPEDHMKMLKLTAEFFGGADPAMQREEFKGLEDAQSRQWAATVSEFYGFFQHMRELRRADPQDDLITFVDALRTKDGEPWPERIRNGFLATVAPAGIDTTRSAIAGAMLAFTRFPEQWDLAKSDPSVIPTLVDEAIRWVTPTKNFMRNATRDTEVSGVPIAAGDRMCMMLFSGNRDAAVFERPHDFVITRRPNPHVSFSHGPHVCLGQHIARSEMRILFTELLPRLKSIEITGEPEREQSNLVSNWRTMPVRFVKA